MGKMTLYKLSTLIPMADYFLGLYQQRMHSRIKTLFTFAFYGSGHILSLSSSQQVTEVPRLQNNTFTAGYEQSYIIHGVVDRRTTTLD